MSGSRLFCPSPCGRCLGSVPGAAIWTGAVGRMPPAPDGLLYVYCKRCRNWQRFEITPPREACETDRSNAA